MNLSSSGMNISVEQLQKDKYKLFGSVRFDDEGSLNTAKKYYE